jgi:hypothetical protein
MATSECWLKGMDVINAAESLMSCPTFRREARKENAEALRRAPGDNAHKQLAHKPRIDAINLTDFVQPNTIALLHPVPLSGLMLSTLRGGAIRT